MKRQDIVDVFVASPGELRTERATIAETIAELNDTWADYIGLRLQLLRWETRTWPATGDDAQDVINRQIGDNYNILIVIVGARLGQPTKRSASGTAEEFERAYARQLHEPGSVQIMVYFKRVAAPDSAVQRFRTTVADLGVYYWNYATKVQFAQAVRIHLSRQVQKLARRDRVLPKAERRFAAPRQQDLERLAATVRPLATSARLGATQFTERAAEYTAGLGRLSQYTKAAARDLLNLSRPGFRHRAGGRQAVLRRLSRQLEMSAAELDHLGRAAFVSFRSALGQLGRILEFTAPISPLPLIVRRTIGPALPQAKGLAEEVSVARDAHNQLRNNIASGPDTPDSPGHMRARARLLEIVDGLDEEFTSSLRLARDLVRGLEDILHSEWYRG